MALSMVWRNGLTLYIPYDNDLNECRVVRSAMLKYD